MGLLGAWPRGQEAPGPHLSSGSWIICMGSISGWPSPRSGRWLPALPAPVHSQWFSLPHGFFESSRMEPYWLRPPVPGLEKCVVVMFSFSGYLSTQGLGAGVSSTQQGEGGEVPRGRSRSCHRGWGRRARQGRPQMASVLVPCAALTNCHKMTRVCLCACVQLLSHDQLVVTPSTIVPQVPVSMQFPRQEYWSGLPFPTPGDLPDLGIESVSLGSPALAGGFFTTWETLQGIILSTLYFTSLHKNTAKLPVFTDEKTEA